MAYYKGIKYNFYEKHNLLEFNVNENDIIDSHSFIEKIIILVELVDKSEPDYVVFNKSEKDFEIDEALYEFGHQYVFHNILKTNVKEIFFLVTESRYKLYKENPNLQFLKPFKTKEKMFEYLDQKI